MKLRRVARSMYDLDRTFLKRLIKPVKKSSTTSNCSEPRLHIDSNAFYDVKMRMKYMDDDVTFKFSRQYLTDSSFTWVWTKALKSIKATLLSKKAGPERNNICDQFRKSLETYTSLAVALEAALMVAASQGLLDEGIEVAIEERWRSLDKFLDWYFKTPGLFGEHQLPPTREISTWLVMNKCDEDLV
jgi:hypothetical protein